MSGKKKKEKVREEKTVLDEKVSPREKFKEIGALFFVLCAAFVFISLVTYTPQDDPASHYDSMGGPVMNKGGRLGAELAYTLFSVLGVAAYVLVFFAGFWSFLVFFRRRVRGLYIKLIAAGVTVMASATLMSFQPFFTASAIRYRIIPRVSSSDGKSGRATIPRSASD